MTNPYFPGSTISSEYDVWERGLLNGGSERHLLREFHSKQGLLDLQACIQAATGAVTRVTSMWIDRYPIAYPSAPSTLEPRELADLAIVVRAKGTDGIFRQRMLLLQGKVDTPSWKTAGSSPKEIDFLEKVPPFELFTSSQVGRKPLGSFNLQIDFSTPPYAGIPFWSYLMFAPPSAQSTSWSPSHAYAAWPSSLLAREPFFGCVVDQTKACLGVIAPAPAWSLPYPPRGANVNKGTPCKEWRRLYLTLALHVHHKLAATLPGGDWKNIAPFGVSLPAFPALTLGPAGALGFASSGFLSKANPQMSDGDALSFASAFRLDSIHNGFQQDRDEALTAQDSLIDRSAPSAGGGEPGSTSASDGDDEPGFCMIFIDAVATKSELR